MTKTNPFRPGAGRMPPYLAGRENEQSALLAETDILLDAKVGNSIIMFGPRGMGKTALLAWLKRQCLDSGIKPILTTPDEALKSTADLAKALFPTSWLPDEFRIATGVTGLLSVSTGWTNPQTKQEGDLKSHLITACKKQPIVLMLDEAHIAPSKDNYRLFLQMAQTVAREAPFLLILSGTPGLTSFLRTLGATFIDRSKKIGIGQIEQTAAQDAIRIPLQDEGITLPDQFPQSTSPPKPNATPTSCKNGAKPCGITPRRKPPPNSPPKTSPPSSHKSKPPAAALMRATTLKSEGNPELLHAAYVVAQAFQGKQSLQPDLPLINAIAEDLREVIPDPRARHSQSHRPRQRTQRPRLRLAPPQHHRHDPRPPLLHALCASPLRPTLSLTPITSKSTYHPQRLALPHIYSTHTNN